MHTALEALLAIISTSALIALCVFLYLAHKDRPATLFPLARPLGGLTKFQTVFFSLAAISLIVCVYYGAKAMLFWMPYSWGTHDDEGYFTSTKEFIAAIIALLGGVSLGVFIEHAIREKFVVHSLAIESHELERILKASHSAPDLRYLLKQYQDKCAELGTSIRASDSDDFYKHPDSQTILVLKNLIELTENQLRLIE